MTTIPQNAIGHIITWQSPVSVALPTLRNALTLASLDAGLARDLHDYSKLARTARGLAKQASGSRRIARPIEGKRARQLTRENHVADGLKYDREAVLAVDESGTLNIDAPELEAAARAEFDAVDQRRTASDVTRLIKRVVESAGSDLMPLREQGGVYFVPSGHKVVTQLETLLKHVGGSIRKFAVTIGDGSAESIAKVVSDYLVSEINALRESVEELDDDKVRADVKARRIERLGELRAKMSAYGSLLASSAAVVQQTLSAADELIVAKLGAA